MDDLVYFVNSQGKTVYLSVPGNRNYFELMGRSGFTAPEVDIFSEKYANGQTRYFGKAIKPRTCRMNMLVRGKDQAERDRIFFDMLNVLLDVDGGEEGKLYVKTSDGVMYYLKCVYSAGAKITEQYKTIHKFALEFYAADPWFYREDRYPIESASSTITVANHSKYPVNLQGIFKPYGTFSVKQTGNILIEHTTKDRLLALQADTERFVNGKDRLVVDAHTATAWYEFPNGGKDYTTMLDNWADLGPFDLDPGNNDIEVQLGNNIGNYFTELYLSVLYKVAGV